ncbi:MAG: 3-oxoacyl-ACP reductase FabG [Halobacteriales archaeon]
MSHPAPLADRTCLVTGASRGIGAAIATRLAEDGAEVAVNYKSSLESAEQTAEAIRDAGGHAVPVEANVADRDAVAAMADAVHDEFGTVDVLVNNAGINADRRFDRMRESDWQNVMDVNLSGAFHCTDAFYEDLVGSDHGRLINISSIVGQHGNYGQSNYAATKAGLIGFTKAIAKELGRYETTANCVAPGFTLTDMVRRLDEDIQERIRSKITLGRFAEVEEVAGVVAFVAGPDASYVTGEVLTVDGDTAL